MSTETYNERRAKKARLQQELIEHGIPQPITGWVVGIRFGLERMRIIADTNPSKWSIKTGHHYYTTAVEFIRSQSDDEKSWLAQWFDVAGFEDGDTSIHESEPEC